MDAEQTQPVRTFERLIKILKANGIITKDLDFNQEQILIENVTSLGNYLNKIEVIGDKAIIIKGKKYIREIQKL